MKTSIALCTYNGEKFLNAQLESFLNQTKSPDELIICDDFSTDSTVEIIKEFQKKSTFPVRLEINQNQLGVVKNFAKAISLCTGEIIFLSDQDDVWLAEKIEVITRQFEQNTNLGLIFTEAELIDEIGKTLNRNLFAETFRKTDKSKPLFDLCLNKNVVTGATMAFRAKYRDEFLPIPDNIPNLIHDRWIALVISATAECDFLERPLINYRQHGQQQLGLFGKTYKNSIARLKEEIEVLQNFPDYFANEILLKKLAQEKGLIGEIIGEKRELIRHYETRMNLPSNNLKRIPSIISEIFSGRYTKFSNGWKSAVKDALETKLNLE
jgi:glycosyltransferase involved in cell wall biosynthesis